MGGTCSTHKTRNAYNILVGKHEETIRRRWEDNFKVDIKELTHDRASGGLL
jgi:hypothetical protein